MKSVSTVTQNTCVTGHTKKLILDKRVSSYLHNAKLSSGYVIVVNVSNSFIITNFKRLYIDAVVLITLPALNQQSTRLNSDNLPNGDTCLFILTLRSKADWYGRKGKAYVGLEQMFNRRYGHSDASCAD